LVEIGCWEVGEKVGGQKSLQITIHGFQPIVKISNWNKSGPISIAYYSLTFVEPTPLTSVCRSKLLYLSRWCLDAMFAPRLAVRGGVSLYQVSRGTASRWRRWQLRAIYASSRVLSSTVMASSFDTASDGQISSFTNANDTHFVINVREQHTLCRWFVIVVVMIDVDNHFSTTLSILSTYIALFMFLF